MKASMYCKSIAASLLWHSGYISSLLSHRGKGGIAILMYHRVLPRTASKAGIQPGMYVNCDTFEKHIEFLNERFTIVSLESVLTQEHQPSSKPLCAITFDDGWFDFYKYAFPILKRNNAPATVFLPTAFIGTDKFFWTDHLAVLMDGQNRDIPAGRNLHPLTRELIEIPGSQELRLETAISHLKKHTVETVEAVISDLEVLFGRESNPLGRSFLKWEEVHELYRSGLVNYGSHTVNHRIMTAIGMEEARFELESSKNKLLAERLVAPGFIPFCYPNGNYDTSIRRLVAEAGYHAAVTTVNGWNDEGRDKFSLKRISVHEDVSRTSALFASKLACFSKHM